MLPLEVVRYVRFVRNSHLLGFGVGIRWARDQSTPCDSFYFGGGVGYLER